MKFGVYRIRNVINGKSYIGSASTNNGITQRWHIHRHLLRNNKHHSIHLQRAWNKHEEPAFVFEVLLYCDSEMCLRYEQNNLDHYQPEYNVCKIARSRLSVKASKEIRAKMTYNARIHRISSGHPRALQESKKIGASKLRVPSGSKKNEIARKVKNTLTTLNCTKYT